ncbi:MAG TPA: hypothetical protein VGG57_06905 [Stellaceae bacterium]
MERAAGRRHAAGHEQVFDKPALALQLQRAGELQIGIAILRIDLDGLAIGGFGVCRPAALLQRVAVLDPDRRAAGVPFEGIVVMRGGMVPLSERPRVVAEVLPQIGDDLRELGDRRAVGALLVDDGLDRPGVIPDGGDVGTLSQNEAELDVGGDFRGVAGDGAPRAALCEFRALI